MGEAVKGFWEESGGIRPPITLAKPGEVSTESAAPAAGAADTPKTKPFVDELADGDEDVAA
jgi:hypothetical protein